MKYFDDPLDFTGGLMNSKNQYWLGAIMGVFLTIFCFLVIDKLTEKDPISSLNMPKDVISAYNMGIKDALDISKPSNDLEMACATLWSKSNMKE